MPYTPPAQRSPAVSVSSTPSVSRRPSYQSNGVTPTGPVSSPRPELPRSTSYLTRHRRTPSVKSASFAEPETSEPTPPNTADGDKDDVRSLSTHISVRQSPPPVTDDTRMPTGAVLSPPESTQNSSDDEDTGKDRGRQLENLAELQAAIRIIEQHRESSPMRTAKDIAKANQALMLLVPDRGDVSKPTTAHIEQALSEGNRRILHVRANTDSSVFDLREPTSVSASDEEEEDESEEEIRSRRKPPMVRKKSGELVRPALRPSSSRRRPSSMPGTPTFSKAVHFDSHLEHVRHFLQVDRPLAVSAGSSPVEAYESDTEFPFGEEAEQDSRQPPFEWEIVVSNFPAETPERLCQPVRVERVFLSTDNKNLIGTVAVGNWAYQKFVIARFTLDYWKTTSEVVAEYSNDVRAKRNPDGYDRFNFSIKLADQANLEAKTMFFCVKYAVNGQEHWDNNNNTNFQIDFRKKAKPQNGKKGMQGAASRGVNGLPRSNKRSPTSGKPKMMPTTFDDFADGFDSKYSFSNFVKPVNDFLGDAPTAALRLKGVKSAVNLPSENISQKTPNPSGQAFAYRYDFGASLSAAIQAANTVLGEKSGLPTTTPKKVAPAQAAAAVKVAQAVISPQPAASGTDSPRPAGSEKPGMASQSYNELLDKYCFFGSVKSSPQLKDGTLSARPGQYDGGSEDYILRSQSPSPPPGPSPAQNQATVRSSTPQRVECNVPSGRAVSPAPMTGLASGTSSLYPRSIHGGFALTEAHAPAAIRG